MRYADQGEWVEETVVQTVRETCRHKWWRAETGPQALRDLNAALSAHYQIDSPMIVVDGTLPSYNHLTQTICLDKISLVSFLHEFAHAVWGGSEIKARQFSCAVFMRAFPRLYEKACANGTLLYQ